MLNAFRPDLKWTDTLRLEYWRQVIRLTRVLRQIKQWVLPLRRYLWLPVLVGIVAYIGGFVYAVGR